MTSIPRRLVLSSFCLLGLLASPVRLTAQVSTPSPEEPAMSPIPTLTVQGSAEVRVAPDRATVRLGIESQRDTAAEAQQQTNAVARKILDNLRAAGVPDDQVRTAELQLYPVYSQPNPRFQEPQEPEITGYRAANVVTVEVTDLARVGPVIDAGLEGGANRLEGLSFGLQDEGPARREALKKAIRDARAKADAMAEGLEVTLGPILDASEGSVSFEAPRFAKAAMAMEADFSTPVAGGDVNVSARVTLRYRLEP
jgi:uncharacterized protein